MVAASADIGGDDQVTRKLQDIFATRSQQLPPAIPASSIGPPKLPKYGRAVAKRSPTVCRAVASGAELLPERDKQFPSSFGRRWPNLTRCFPVSVDVCQCLVNIAQTADNRGSGGGGLGKAETGRKKHAFRKLPNSCCEVPAIHSRKFPPAMASSVAAP